MLTGRHYLALVLAVAFLLMLYVVSSNKVNIANLTKSMPQWTADEPKGSQSVSGKAVDLKRQLEAVSQASDMIKIQRDTVSRKMNGIRKQLAQAECQLNKDKSPGISVSGGWCEKESTEGGGQHITDKKLAEALAEFLKGKLVASFGDGPGRYKALIDATGKLKRYDAYDGAPFCETTSEGRVKFLDLSLEQFGLPMYDYVISLEVAEHIPKQFEHIYVDNIVRHAKEGVILSWAKIGQGGFQHVNNKDFTDVKFLFEKLGFVHNEAMSISLRNSATAPWLQDNVNVFERRSPNDISDLFI